MKIPYIAFGNDEIENSPAIREGDMVECRACGQKHIVKCAKNIDTGKKSIIILFYECLNTGSVYLVGVNGKKISIRRGESHEENYERRKNSESISSGLC